MPRADAAFHGLRVRTAIGAHRAVCAAFAGSLALTSGLSGCGEEVPAGGVAQAPIQASARRFVPDELIPGHLDLVVRVDLERTRVALGQQPESALGERLGDEPLVLRALAKGRSALVALRSSSLEDGDHVLVVEGELGALEIDASIYPALPSNDERVRIHARSSPARRSGIELIVAVDRRILAFASPLEADALLRVADRGPDAHRGAPLSEGLLSIDFRPRRLDPELERRFPSFARLVAQTERVRGALVLEGEGLGFDARVTAKSEASASRIARFLEALRAGASSEGPTAPLAALRVEPVGSHVHLKMPVGADALLGLLGSSARER